MQLVLFNPWIEPLSGATAPGQSGPGSDDNEGVLCIPQSSSITGTSPSDCLVSYQGHSLGRRGSCPSAEKQSVYSTAPADRARKSLYLIKKNERLNLSTLKEEYLKRCSSFKVLKFYLKSTLNDTLSSNSSKV